MTPTAPNLRAETPDDAVAIRQVHEAAFPGPDEAAIVDALRASDALTISLVATVEDQIIGHIAFSPITINNAPAGLGLAPVAVLPDCQSRGIGAALITEGLAQCRELACGLVVVLGDPAYYARFGFQPAANWQLQDEYGGGDAFQAIVLDDSTLPGKHSQVLYAAPFRP